MSIPGCLLYMLRLIKHIAMKSTRSALLILCVLAILTAASCGERGNELLKKDPIRVGMVHRNRPDGVSLFVFSTYVTNVTHRE